MTPSDYYRTLTSLRNAHSETQRKEILQDVLRRYGTQTYQQMVKALEVRRQRV